MTPFVRTNSGLSNLHLFYNADILVFTEGGPVSFSEEEVGRGKYNRSAADIKFWQSILDACKFEKTVEFRAVGSKTSSNSICQKIQNGEIQNIVVARDRDLDNYCGESFNSPFILHTKGYSWENDVFTRDLTLSHIESLLFEAKISQQVVDVVEEAYSDFAKYGKHLVKLELIFRQNGIRFICGLKGERFFNHKKSPYINKEEVSKILQEKKALLARPVQCEEIDMTDICPFRDNYGKLLENLSWTVIAYCCKKYSDFKSVPKKLIGAGMIDRFSNQVLTQEDPYYKNLIQQLSDSL